MGDAGVGSCLSIIRDADWWQRMSMELTRGEFLAPDFSLMIPPRFAAFLETRAGITDEERRRIMVTDPIGYRFLVALHLAAKAWRSQPRGNAAEVDAAAGSGEWLTSTQVATLLGLTRRCITQRCAAGKFRARRLGRLWMVHHSEVHAHRADLA
ncbi:helix-turn-helix domain-containing protein [Mycobacteroides abscessus]|uniref:helix-turn-helix domain-containing protein n=2 Tax=Mycobacteroides abscessus TaxID=36809 RepID=UPI00104251CB|nr:helix-turn-helix domain-containing protein [Mycobacteroides abscessus]QSN53752.1 helix-turn-helix domain-containing protein [Mycobacteroides abscessus subsp. abscessus]